MQQFDREYFAEHKAQIKEMHHLRNRIWQMIVVGMVYALIINIIEYYIISNYTHWRNYESIKTFYGKYVKVSTYLSYTETALIAGLLLIAVIIALLSVRYFALRGIHRDIQQEYQLLRPHISPHEKAKRSGYEYKEVTWPDDDGKFPDDIRLEERVRMRIYADD